MDPLGEAPDEMWDEEDGISTTCSACPTHGCAHEGPVPGRVLPLCATTVIEADVIDRYPQIADTWLPSSGVTRTAGQHRRPFVPSVPGRRLLSLVTRTAAAHPGPDAG